MLAYYFKKEFSSQYTVLNIPRDAELEQIKNNKAHEIVDETVLQTISLYACNLFWITLLNHILADYNTRDPNTSVPQCYGNDQIFNKAITYLKLIKFTKISFYKQGSFNTFPETLMAELPESNKNIPFNLSKETCASILIGAHGDHSVLSGSKSATDFLTALKSDAIKWLKAHPSKDVDENNFLIFIARILKYSGDTSHLHMAVCIYKAYEYINEAENLTINLYLSERPLGYRACVLQQYYPELKKKLNIIINDVTVYNQLMDHKINTDKYKNIKKICYILPANDIIETYQLNYKEFIQILHYMKRIQYSNRDQAFSNFYRDAIVILNQQKKTKMIEVISQIQSINDIPNDLEVRFQLDPYSVYPDNNIIIEQILRILKQNILFKYIIFEDLNKSYHNWKNNIKCHNIPLCEPSFQRIKCSSRKGPFHSINQEPTSIFLLEAKKKCMELLFQNRMKQKELIETLEGFIQIEKVICTYHQYKTKFENMKSDLNESNELSDNISHTLDDMNPLLKRYLKEIYKKTIDAHPNNPNTLHFLFKELTIYLYDKIMIHLYFNKSPAIEEEFQKLIDNDTILYSFIKEALFNILNATKEEDTYSIKNKIKLKFISFFILLLKQEQDGHWLNEDMSDFRFIKNMKDHLRFIISKQTLKKKLKNIFEKDVVTDEIYDIFKDSKSRVFSISQTKNNTIKYQFILIKEIYKQSEDLTFFRDLKDKSAIIETYMTMIDKAFTNSSISTKISNSVSVTSVGGNRKTHKNREYLFGGMISLKKAATTTTTTRKKKTSFICI